MWALVLSSGRVWVASASAGSGSGGGARNAQDDANSLRGTSQHRRTRGSTSTSSSSRRRGSETDTFSTGGAQQRNHRRRGSIRRGVSPVGRFSDSGSDDSDNDNNNTNNRHGAAKLVEHVELLGVSDLSPPADRSEAQRTTLREAVVNALRDALLHSPRGQPPPSCIICGTSSLVKAARGAFDEAKQQIVRNEVLSTTRATLLTSISADERAEASSVASIVMGTVLASRRHATSFGDGEGRDAAVSGSPSLVLVHVGSRRFGGMALPSFRQLLSGPTAVVFVLVLVVALALSQRWRSGESSDGSASGALSSMPLSSHALPVRKALQPLLSDRIISSPAFDALSNALMAAESRPNAPLIIGLIAAQGDSDGTPPRAHSQQAGVVLERVIRAITAARCAGERSSCATTLAPDLATVPAKELVASALERAERPVFIVPVGPAAPPHVDMFTAAWDDKHSQVAVGDRQLSTARSIFVLSIDARGLTKGQNHASSSDTLAETASLAKFAANPGSTELDAALKRALKDAGWPDRVCQRISHVIVV